MEMPYERLGNSGLIVSRLCLGAMMFGGRTNVDDSLAIISRAREEGVNFIDTADGYNKGGSEIVVGRAVKCQRDWWVVATKVFNPMSEGPNGRGLSRKWLLAACEHSLRRLKLDYIDIYYLHKEDLKTPLEETIEAIGSLMSQGKIRYFGLSNFRAWRIAQVCALCDKSGIPRPNCQPTALQPAQSTNRSRTTPGLRSLWSRCVSLQSARARCFDRQICARCRAGWRVADRPR